MGKKPSGLESIIFEPPVEFNGVKISKVEVDLIHINYGKNVKIKRSEFSLKEIKEIIKSNLDELDLDPVNEDGTHFYFAFELDINNRQFRLIFCWDKNDLSLGIITLYRKG